MRVSQILIGEDHFPIITVTPGKSSLRCGWVPVSRLLSWRPLPSVVLRGLEVQSPVTSLVSNASGAAASVVSWHKREITSYFPRWIFALWLAIDYCRGQFISWYIFDINRYLWLDESRLKLLYSHTWMHQILCCSAINDLKWQIKSNNNNKKKRVLVIFRLIIIITLNSMPSFHTKITNINLIYIKKKNRN